MIRSKITKNTKTRKTRSANKNIPENNLMARLKSIVKNKGIKIAFPESCEERTLKAIKIITKEKIAIPILIGNPEKIKSAAKKAGINLNRTQIVDTTNQADTTGVGGALNFSKDKYANRLYEIRKEKGMSKEEAKKLIETEEIYLATIMLELGEIDGIISGAIHPTKHTLKPAFQIIKTTEGISAASGMFIMKRQKQIMDKGIKSKKDKKDKASKNAKEEIFIFADCGVIPYPTAEQLADIAISSAKSAAQFGIKPRVAMLSFSTMGSAEHESVTKVKTAVKLAQEKAKLLPELSGASEAIIEGELQADAALVKEVAELKSPNSKIKGDANVLIFPNLDAGNIGYKLVQRLGNFEAIGPIVQGLKKPVNDLSRGCATQEIVDMAIITALQAMKKR